MATKVTKIRLVIELDPETEQPVSVEVCRYRLEDDAAAGMRTGGGTISITVSDLNKIAHNTGAVGELIKDIVAASRADAGI